MRILFDHQTFSLQRFGGISRYFTRLIEELSAMEETEVSLPFPLSINTYLQESHLSAGHFDPSGGRNFRGRSRIYAAINQHFIKRALRRQDFDVFHPTFLSDYFLDVAGHSPFVLTIYDTVPERLPKLFPNYHDERLRKEKLLARADAITAISEHTRQDLIDIYHVPAERITTIHLAADKAAPTKPAGEMPERYVLFVGQRYAYKNFACFAKAMVRCMEKDDSLHMVCVGGGPVRAEEAPELAPYLAANRVHQISASEGELSWLYDHALGFVFPSKYEGFGIPILESFQAGCPTIVSRASCFPEIAGEGALYFDPDDTEELTHQLEKVIRDPESCAPMLAAARVQAEKFSWRKTAEKTRALYENVARKG